MNNIKKEQIKELNSLGKTDSEISRLLNISSSSVNYNRNAMNLPTNFNHRTYTSEYDRKKGYIMRNIRLSCKRRALELDLNHTDFELPDTCPILNIKLKYKGEGSGNDHNHATVDRIDNSKGYIKGNIIILSRLANSMKNEASFDELILFCKNIPKLIDTYKNQGALGSFTDCFPNTFIRKFSLDS